MPKRKSDLLNIKCTVYTVCYFIKYYPDSNVNHESWVKSNPSICMQGAGENQLLGQPELLSVCDCTLDQIE